jgi:hypothetical protein
VLDLFLEELQEYRAKEAELGAKVFHQMILGNVTPEYMKGAVEMLKKVINLPVDMASGHGASKEQKERAQVLAVQMLDALEAKMMRRSLTED